MSDPAFRSLRHLFIFNSKRFEVERLAPEDVQMEDLNYYYANYSRCVLCFVNVDDDLWNIH